MSEAREGKWTIGEWIVAEEPWQTIKRTITVRARVAPGREPMVAKIPASPCRDADAALIAAAPNLYRALSDALLFFGGNPSQVTQVTVAGWRAALAKARGEHPTP